MTKPLSKMDEWSRKIDDIIEQEQELKSKLPDHPRFSQTRIHMDNRIKGLRAIKKEALTYWKEMKRDPRITP